MANLDAQNRLLVPKSLMDLSEKSCYLYYDFNTEELYISLVESSEDYLVDKVKFDSRNRFFLNETMRSAFSIEKSTKLVFCLKDRKVYFKRGPLFI